MKKFTKKLIAMLLCVAMIGSVLPMSVRAEGDETVYTLYPTPHTVTYGEGSFELTDINAIYGEGIDEYTKARLVETAELIGLTATEAEAADSAKTNVYVAIYGSGDAVESYILENYDVDTTLFEKIDSNFVAINNGEIVVLGVHTDACFYGLTTLYQLFGQLTGRSVRNLTIDDYADVVSRGFIEGYYGNPWSVEDRAALMTWGGYYKLNSYFYAPKDDPKHNSAWRELYTEEELETLVKPLAEAGNASKCRYVYALHPFMHNPIRFTSDAVYEEDMAILKAKFTQVIECGVRQIAILADDASSVGATNNQRVLEDMCAWLEEMQQTYPDLKLNLPFVAPGFEYAGYGQSYYRNFPENVQIVMTGGQVWGYVTQRFIDSFYNNVGRGPYMWINWPCSDNSKNHLIMGGYADWLYPGVNPEKLQGIVLNPMQQSEPSKVAIFGNACYSWNIWETREEADAAWEASFSCVNHKSIVPNAASEAFKELSKHMINQAMTNGVVNLQESVAIRDELSAMKTALTTETYNQTAIDSLREEFVNLQNAAKIFREQGDQRIVEQIVYWMNCWDDTTEAAIAYLDALSAILDGAPEAEVWEHYAKGQAAWENSRTHALWYIDHWEYAEVGVQHIVPFMKALHNYLSEYVLDIVDPSGGLSSGGGSTGGALSLTAFDGNRPGYYSNYYLSNVVDGNLSTAVWYSDVAQSGQYIGVNLGRAVKLGTVTFTQDAGDRFVSYELQYSTDGSTYTTYGTYTDAVLSVDLAADGIVAQYVRFVGSNSNGKWVKIYEIGVTEAPATSVLTNREELKSLTTRILADRGELVCSDSITLSPNEYVGMDLGRIKDLATITATEQGELTIQVSVNNVDWTNVEAGDVTEDGRYVRLINLTEADVTVSLTEFSATSNEITGPTLHSSDIGVNSSWGVAEDCRENGGAFDGDVNSITEFADFVSAGQYIIYDLGQTREIEKLEIYCNDSAVNYIRDAVIQVSMDMTEWTDVVTIGDGVENTGESAVTCIDSDAGYSQATSSYPNKVSIEGTVEKTPARYLRILMTANNYERAVVFNEIEINGGEYVSVSNDPTFVSTAVEVQGYDPQHMTDGDLTTSWKPNTTEAGSMVYTFSEDLTANRINIVQKTVTNARVYLYAENDGERAWLDMGTLDKTLVSLVCNNDLNLALKIEWDAEAAPNITEIVRYTVEGEVVYYNVTIAEMENGTVTADKAQAAEGEVVTLTATPNEGYKLSAIYVNGTAIEGNTFRMPAEDVTVTAEFVLEDSGEVDGDAVQAAKDAQAAAEAAQKAAEEAQRKAEEAQAAAEEAAANAEADREKAERAQQEAKEAAEAAAAAQAAAEEAQAAAEAAEEAAAAHDAAAAEAAAAAAKNAQEVAELYEQVAAVKAEMAQYLADILKAADDAKEDREKAEAAELACAKYYALIRLAQYADPHDYEGELAEQLRAAIESGNAAIENAETAEAVEAALAAAMAEIDRIIAGIPFVDVPAGSYFADPVLWAVENDVTSGTSETTFNPERLVTRAEAVTFLWRAAGEPEPTTTVNPFVDVDEDVFYYKAVLWAVEQNITAGVDSTHFDPFGIANRVQIVTFLWRAAGEPEVAGESSFADVPADAWFAAPVLWAVEQGITNGVDATHFAPTVECNRAQMVTFLYRAYK